MKKRSLFLIIILTVILLLQTGCSKEDQTNSADWEKIIQTDFFSGDSAVEQAIAEAVSIKVKQIEDQLTVTIKAPDICEGLLNWMESVSDEDFTEAAMEQEILRLLKDADKVEVDYVMGCSGEGDTAEIAYTSEFGEAMSCGLTRFYAEVTQRILEEMGNDA